MTENKRFELAWENFDGWAIYDTTGEYSDDEDYIDWLSGQKAVDVLNHFADENEQLRKEMEDLGTAHAEEITNIEDEFDEEILKLEKENEQLKQFKKQVCNLIDTKIKHYEHKPISAPVSQPMSVNFDYDVDRLARLSELQDLKWELKSE